VDLRALAEYVELFPSKRAVLLGDFVADEFQYGEISRVSREAPVLILRHRETHVLPGGGANAANNFAALGARVAVVSAVGHDAAGNALLAEFRRMKVDVSGVQRTKGWATPTKSRFLAGWTHTVAQQVLRVDREPQSALPDSARKKLEQALRSRLRGADALAVSDYGFGVATPGLVAAAARRLNGNMPVTVDSRYGLHRYVRCGVTSATPNESELEALHATSIGKDVGALLRCGELTRDKMKLQALLVTRGKDGMALFEQSGVTYIAVHGSDQAVDVTGAGDTVLAAYTLGLACGASPLEAAHIANIAGGLVVMKRGTATVSRDELLEAIHEEAAGAAH
jgi:rfaE bifunctional protein kinase chain/domain